MTYVNGGTLTMLVRQTLMVDDEGAKRRPGHENNVNSTKTMATVLNDNEATTTRPQQRQRRRRRGHKRTRAQTHKGTAMTAQLQPNDGTTTAQR